MLDEMPQPAVDDTNIEAHLDWARSTNCRLRQVGENGDVIVSPSTSPRVVRPPMVALTFHVGHAGSGIVDDARAEVLWRS